jgi:hypothetical protein
MIAAVIFVVSVATLLMFFASYCRSLVAASSRHTLSREVRDVTGIWALASGQDFARVMQLLQLCPERPDDRTALKAVEVYYSLMVVLEKSLARLAPSVRTWAEHELDGCANFAVVCLDRRIAFNREMLSQQGEL